MSELTSFNALFTYSDKMNRIVFGCAGKLEGSRLDQELDIGLGSLRRILIHIHNGEATWLARWQGQIETKWPPENIPYPPAEVLMMLEKVAVQRGQFLTTLIDAKLDAMQTYRDSRGSLFQASLRDMLLQGIVHSIHHRAQAVNAIRRLGGEAPEVDYMVSVRRNV